MNCSNSKKTTNRGNTINKGKGLLIVNPIFLSISLGNKTGLILFNRAIKFGFDLIDPFTINDRFTMRQINQIPSVSLLQSLKFFCHYLKTTNRGNTSNKGKGLLIVNLIFLSISLGNKTGLIPFNSAIRFGLDLIDSFTTNDRFTMRQINQIPSVSLSPKSEVFLSLLAVKED
jgi:hypothetical protein